MWALARELQKVVGVEYIDEVPTVATMRARKDYYLEALAIKPSVLLPCCRALPSPQPLCQVGVNRCHRPPAGEEKRPCLAIDPDSKLFLTSHSNLLT